MSTNEDEKTPATSSAPADDEPRVPHLVVLNGPDVGSVHRVTGSDLIIGRDAAADISLSQATVSRRHARLILRDGDVLIEDLDSTNGTYVGIDRVKGPTLVPEGANIGLGTFTLLRLTRSPMVSDTLSRLGREDRQGRPATKVDSRNYLLDLLQAEHAYARRHGSPLALVFFRVDAASTFADSPEAEPLLKDLVGRAAEQIDAAIRAEDFLASSAADEICVVTRATADQAQTMAERVRGRIESLGTAPTRTSIPYFLMGFTASPSAGRQSSIRRPDRPTRMSRWSPRPFSDGSRASSPVKSRAQLTRTSSKRRRSSPQYPRRRSAARAPPARGAVNVSFASAAQRRPLTLSFSVVCAPRSKGSTSRPPHVSLPMIAKGSSAWGGIWPARQ